MVQPTQRLTAWSIRETAWAIAPSSAAVYAATAAPAKAIRRDKELGAFMPGLAADLVVLDRDLSLKAVYIDGVPIH